ncbi:MAG: hypothetical protein NZ739_08740 [Verrucomicrobiae bacterium]|nr:hypothetical protein [Verrucomicrobiae bacterium]
MIRALTSAATAWRSYVACGKFFYATALVVANFDDKTVGVVGGFTAARSRASRSFVRGEGDTAIDTGCEIVVRQMANK